MNIDMNKIKELQEYSKELKVLYVEDNEEARVSTIEVLYEFFEDITIALDGLEGLDKFNNSTFDLIISDINMPNMNGIAMTEEIRKTDKEIPILIVSAYSESGYFIETIKLGVEGYLLKPIELEQFIIMLSKTIEKIKMKKKIEEYQKSLENANIKLNQDIKNQLYIDHLTSLPNRLALERELFKRNEDYIAMYILDINNFRKINEMYGFDTGNEILNNISKNIKEYAKNKEFSIYKISADEFVLLRRYKDYNLEYLHK
ncbi:MAG: response regulator, partial [Campylobacterota bacterium]|nr:response regulator [Campylobacterota bacterium]